MTCTHRPTEQDIAVSADGMCPLCMATEIERLTHEIEILKSERRHHASQMLAMRSEQFDAEQRLVSITRRWADNPVEWDKDNEDRTFRQIRYAVEHAMAILIREQINRQRETKESI